MHTCCACGHQWETLEKKRRRYVINAVRVNKDGPYCDLCHHLEMACRYADARKLSAVDVMEQYVCIRKVRTNLENPNAPAQTLEEAL